jgi:hypothetical protein
MELVYDALQASRHDAIIEIEEETYALVRKLQVREQLSGVDGDQLFDRFEFQDDGILDQKVHLEPTVELQSLIRNR